MDKSPLKTLTLEDFLESERHKLTGKLTPVTPESFAEWKKKRLDKKAAEEQVRQLPCHLISSCCWLWHASSRLENTDWLYLRRAMQRRQQVVHCLRVASGVPMRTMMNQATKKTMQTLPRGIWRSFDRRQKHYEPRRKRSAWRRRATNLSRATSQRKTLQKTASLVRRTAPMGPKRLLPPLHEESMHFWGQENSEGRVRQTRLFASHNTFASHLSRQASGAYRMDAVIRQNRHESGRTHPSEGITFLPVIFTAYALNGGNHVSRQGRGHQLYLHPGIPRMKRSFCMAHHLLPPTLQSCNC